MLKNSAFISWEMLRKETSSKTLKHLIDSKLMNGNVEGYKKIYVFFWKLNGPIKSILNSHSNI